MVFVPVYVVALSLLGIVMYLSQAIEKIIVEYAKTPRKSMQEMIIIFFTIIIGGMGVFFNIRHIELSYNIHTSFLVFPICILAYFINKMQIDIKRYASIVLTISCGCILFAFIKCGYRIELSQEQIVNGYIFYFISIIGIVFCLSLAKIIQKIKRIGSAFSLLGRYSFSIMALHFFVIKIVDRIYAWIVGEKDPAIFGKWVTAYSDKLWVIYTLVGSFFPILIPVFWKYIKKRWRLILGERRVNINAENSMRKFS